VNQYIHFENRVQEVELLHKEAVSAFLSRTPGDRDRGNALTRAGIVLLSGHFEGYLKAVLVEFVNAFNDRNLGFSGAPQEICYRHIRGLLDGVQNGNSEAATRLKNIFDGTGTLRIEARHFSNIESNPSVDVIESLFGQLGIPNVIEALTHEHYFESTFSLHSHFDGNMANSVRKILRMHVPAEESLDALQAEIARLIDSRWTPKQKRREVGYVAVIQNFLKLRNRIAHGDDALVTDVELEENISSIRKLAHGISKRLDAHLESLSPERPKDE